MSFFSFHFAFQKCVLFCGKTSSFFFLLHRSDARSTRTRTKEAWVECWCWLGAILLLPRQVRESEVQSGWWVSDQYHCRSHWPGYFGSSATQTLQPSCERPRLHCQSVHQHREQSGRIRWRILPARRYWKTNLSQAFYVPYRRDQRKSTLLSVTYLLCFKLFILPKVLQETGGFTLRSTTCQGNSIIVWSMVK